MRDPTKLPDHLRNSVEVVKGDVLEYKDVLNAVRGVSAVVVVLGTRNDLSPTTVMSDGMRNIVNAMKECNVEIVSVCLSAFLFYEIEKVPPMFHEVNADHKRMYDVLQSSGLKYIACFPPHIAGNIKYKKNIFKLNILIADQPATDYQIQIGASPGGRVISKHDLGKFLIDCLDKTEIYGKVCGICTKH